MAGILLRSNSSDQADEASRSHSGSERDVIINIPWPIVEPTITPPSSPQPRAGRNSSGTVTPVLKKWSWSGTRRRGSSAISPVGEVNSDIGSDEYCLDMEVSAACQELQFAVKDIYVSELLPHTHDLVFLNVTTVEGHPFCLELTNRGWRVCSLRHDNMNGDVEYLHLHTRYYETVYALLDDISPGYRREFGGALASRLRELVDAKQVEARPEFDLDDTPSTSENNPTTTACDPADAKPASLILPQAVPVSGRREEPR